MGQNKNSKMFVEEIENFLDVVDQVLNSNTFLLVISLTDEPKNLNKFLNEFIKSKIFKELMIDQDKKRELGLCTSYDFIGNEMVLVPFRTGEFYTPNFKLSLKKITYDKLKKILLNMITTNKSLYNQQLSYEKANPIVHAFLDKIFKDDKLENSIDKWRIYSVEPNFLNLTYIIDEKSGEEEPNDMFCYFDGWGFDSCTVFYNKEKLYMLLTNGMA